MAKIRLVATSPYIHGSLQTSGKVKTMVNGLNVSRYTVAWSQIQFKYLNKKRWAFNHVLLSQERLSFHESSIAALIMSLRHISIAQSAPKDKHVIIFQCSGATT